MSIDYVDMALVLDINEKARALINAQEEQVVVLGELLDLLQRYADSLREPLEAKNIKRKG